MKKYLFLTAVSVLALGMNSANAAQGTATGTATAEILSPMGINHSDTDALDFGQMLAGTYTVTVNTSGNASFSDATKKVGTTSSADKFTITGTKGMSYTLNVPNTITLTGKTKSKTMSVNNVKVKIDTGSEQNAGDIKTSLSGTGATVFVGGTLNVTSDAEVDEYSGTYTVTLTY